ncbi:MAG: hypothetical protein U9R74_02195 [Pseudomonadota bacterium]|nr:hypothetical protein [Pseudomonadota bacterium]
MHLLPRLDDVRTAGAIWYVIFRQSPYIQSIPFIAQTNLKKSIKDARRCLTCRWWAVSTDQAPDYTHSSGNATATSQCRAMITLRREAARQTQEIGLRGWFRGTGLNSTKRDKFVERYNFRHPALRCAGKRSALQCIDYQRNSVQRLESLWFGPEIATSGLTRFVSPGTAPKQNENGNRRDDDEATTGS